MNSKNYLLKGYLSFGNFEVFNCHIFSKRKVNRLIKLLAFFKAFKLVVIVLAACLGYPQLKLYLIDLYLFDENKQKFVDVAIQSCR